MILKINSTRGHTGSLLVTSKALGDPSSKAQQTVIFFMSRLRTGVVNHQFDFNVVQGGCSKYRVQQHRKHACPGSVQFWE